MVKASLGRFGRIVLNLVWSVRVICPPKILYMQVSRRIPYNHQKKVIAIRKYAKEVRSSGGILKESGCFNNWIWFEVG